MTEIAEAPVAAKSGELKRISHWIGGKPVAGTSGRNGPVYNPAKGQQAAEVDFASVEEIDQAVQAAKEAFPAWRAMSLSRRTELFFRIRELVHVHREDIAKLLTAEHGKVLSDAMGEVARGLEVIEYCCGIPELLKGEFSEQASTGIDVYSIRQPLGVVAGITPFNFPAMVPMWMWAPALACGNTFVLKPSEKDPSASVYTAELLKEAGVPDGVFNVVHGDKIAVDAILEHPEIKAVSFVGSTPIAKYVYENFDEARQARTGARRREEPHDRAPRRRRRHGCRRRRLRRLRLRRRAVHGDLAGRRRRRRRGPLHRGGQGAHPEREGRRRDAARLRDGPARHARAPRQGRVATSQARRTRAARSSSTAASRRRRATASGSASRCSTT